MHELASSGIAHLIGFLADGSASTPAAAPDPAVKVAIIGTVGLVLAAIVQAIAGTFQRNRATEPADDPDHDALVAELRRRADAAEASGKIKERQKEKADARIAELERYCIDHGINPRNGTRISS